MYNHYPDFDDHVLVTARQEIARGFSAFIAIHNENRGPAMGGCRILNYGSTDLAVKDVLRLSRGMTYKNAIANIPYGGGKAVIIADARQAKTVDLLHAMGDFVQSLGGRYITSFDSGTTIDDVRTIAERTDFTAGTLAEAGNASRSTAYGVHECMRAAAELVFGSSDLAGATVAIQGAGNVGARLADYLSGEGANIIIADANEDSARAVADRTGAAMVGTDQILHVKADILAPCALGAILTEETIPALTVRAVVGGANNQLATAGDDERLRASGILYCPDYLANAGGIIDLFYQRSSWTKEAVEAHVRGLADTFKEIVDRAERGVIGTAAVADALARERFQSIARASS